MTQLWHLLNAARKKDPEVRAWLKTRIKTGRDFCWIE